MRVEYTKLQGTTLVGKTVAGAMIKDAYEVLKTKSRVKPKIPSILMMWWQLLQ